MPTRKRLVLVRKRSTLPVVPIAVGATGVLALLIVGGVWLSESSTPPPVVATPSRPSSSASIQRKRLEPPKRVEPSRWGEPAMPSEPANWNAPDKRIADPLPTRAAPPSKVRRSTLLTSSGSGATSTTQHKARSGPPILLVDGPADAVSIPEIAAATEMKALGKVDCKPSQLTLALWGGSVASHELGTFRLQPSPTSTQPFRWRVDYQRHEGPLVPIAEFVLVNQHLQFGWTAKSKSLEEANCLRNCVLNLAAGQRNQPVALRTPLGGNHLKLGLNRKSTSEAYSIPWLPKGGRMKLELLPQSIDLPPHELSQKVLRVECDRCALKFSAPDELPLTVKIQNEMDDSLLISAAAQWTSLKNNDHAYDGAALAKEHARLLKKLSVVAATDQQSETEVAAEQLAKLLSLAQRIEAAGPLPFRVVMNVDGYEVVVLQSDGYARADTMQVPAPEE